MRFIAAAFIVLMFCVAAFCQVQETDKPQAVPFHISSLNTAFGMQGDFEGEYRLYPTWLEIKMTKAELHVSEHCPYKGRRLISAIKMGLVTSVGEKSWKIVTKSDALALEQVMRSGENYALGEFYLHVPKEEMLDLSKHWLLVQIEDTALDFPDEKRQKGYAFAHSCRDIFVQKQKLDEH